MKKRMRAIPTQQNLANVALHYLSRYAASEASLRRVLTNRLRRAALDRPDFAADIAQQNSLHSVIETIIEGYKKSGVLNDAAFAAVKVGSLRRQGRSRRGIEQRLAAKGIGRDAIRTALVQHDDAGSEEGELKAAKTLAQRRKLGPFRKHDKKIDDDLRRKEFAIMARAGFSLDVVRRVLQMTADIDETDG